MERDAMTLCPRPDCGGNILSDGVCTLCGRSVQAPPASLPLLNGHKGKALVSDRCATYKHEKCQGTTKVRDFAGRIVHGETVPCECACGHGKAT